MSYDGPSFYKVNQEQLQGNKEKKKRINQRESWTQNEKRNDQSPPPTAIERDFKGNAKQTNQKGHFFRSKKIPKSLQKLDGWKKTEWDRTLLAELEKRLVKEEEDYLLFGVESEPDDLTDKKILNESTKSVKQKKINEVQEKMEKNLNKPATGLHRSLSKIIAEDQKALKNGKNNLDRLFNN